MSTREHVSVVMTRTPVVVPPQGTDDCNIPCEKKTVTNNPRRYEWTRLLRRVFDIDVLSCAKCGAARMTDGGFIAPTCTVVWAASLASRARNNSITFAVAALPFAN